MKPTPKRLAKSKLRLSVLLTILVISICYAYVRVSILNIEAYAWTISLGNGYGYVVYTDRYYLELSPVLQESTRLHESIHLKEGTLRFWSNDGEIHAYSAQLLELDRIIKETWERYRKTHNPKDLKDIYDLTWFRGAMEESLSYYRD